LVSGKYVVMASKVCLLDECVSSNHGYVKVRLTGQMPLQILENEVSLFCQTYTYTTSFHEIMSY
jgi:hypothetical protein